MEFSFSGILSHAERIAKNGWADGKIAKSSRAEPMQFQEAQFLARRAMQAAFEHLASRVVQFLGAESRANEYLNLMGQSAKRGIKTMVLSGGVAANGFLRHILRKYLDARSFQDVEITAPPQHLCTDNAAMIAWAAAEISRDFPDAKEGRSKLPIRALRKWSLENIRHPEREEDGQETIRHVISKVGSSLPNGKEEEKSEEMGVLNMSFPARHSISSQRSDPTASKMESSATSFAETVLSRHKEKEDNHQLYPQENLSSSRPNGSSSTLQEARSEDLIEQTAQDIVKLEPMIRNVASSEELEMILLAQQEHSSRALPQTTAEAGDEKNDAVEEKAPVLPNGSGGY